MSVSPTNVPTLLPALKALADEKRLRILMELAGGERCVCDLQSVVDAGQSLLSFHLKALRDAGLVNDRRDGRWVYYSLNPAGLTALEEAVRSLRDAAESTWQASARCCD